MGTNGMYFDEVRMTKTGGPPARLVATPNQVVANDNLNFKTNGPLIAGNTRGWLYVWAVNDLFFPFRLAKIKTGRGGVWEIDFTVPSGLGSLDINFVAFLVNSGDKVTFTNQELVLIR